MRYPFRCTKCALEFDVSRPARDAGKAASCPIDGAAAERVFTVPVTNLKRPPSSTSAAPAAGFSHSGHSHGPGTAHHAH